MYLHRQRLQRCVGTVGKGRQRWQSKLWLVIGFLGISQRQASANGDHLHIGPGGVFFLILGGLIFLGGLGIVMYFLFRGEPSGADEEFDESDEPTRGESESS